MNLLGKNRLVAVRTIGFILLLFSGCASQTNNLYTEIKPEFKEREIKRIGILKFKNLSLDPNAGLKVANIFHKELSSHRHYELIAPAEMSEKGFGMEFVKTPEGIAGLPGSAKQVERPKITKKEATIEKAPDLDAIVTGVITRYDNRDGSRIAVNRPASVAFKVYLISVKDNKILWSANFAETQVALFDNLLLADRFNQAGGVWITSDALTELGMQRVIKAFPGLIPESLKKVTE